MCPVVQRELFVSFLGLHGYMDPIGVIMSVSKDLFITWSCDVLVS